MAKNELQFINILKALAIILVIITHNNFYNGYRINIFFKFFIDMAVPMFMVITGFNYSLSFSKIKNNSLVNIIKSLFRKFKRLTIPFCVIFLIEWLFNIQNIQIHHITTGFINGGIGPGSYYYPVMVQLILLFPFIYLLIKKYDEKGLIYIFLIQFLFETICYYISIKSSIYRIMGFRYLLFVALGSYLILKKDKINSNALLLMFIIGVNYITILTCSNSILTIAPFTLWSGSSLLATFYIFPIFAYIYYNYNINNSNCFLNVFGEIGKASWHIFLIQMLYYCIIPQHFHYSLKIMIPISLILCIILGWMFYRIEKSLNHLLCNKFLSQ